MKGTLESVDKLQADLDKANAAQAALELKAKTTEDQMVQLQRQAQALPAKAKEKQATDDTFVELENEIKDMMARG